MKTIKDSHKLSLTECKKILNVKGNHYTDDEILAIRNWLYLIGEIAVMSLEETTKKPLNQFQGLMLTDNPTQHKRK